MAISTTVKKGLASQTCLTVQIMKEHFKRATKVFMLHCSGGQPGLKVIEKAF